MSIFDHSMPDPRMFQGNRGPAISNEDIDYITNKFGRIKYGDRFEAILDKDWSELSPEDKRIALTYFPNETKALVAMANARGAARVKEGKQLIESEAKKLKTLMEAYNTAAKVGETFSKNIKTRNEAIAVEEKLPHEKEKLQAETGELGARAAKQREETTDIRETRPFRQGKMGAETGKLQAETGNINQDTLLKQIQAKRDNVAYAQEALDFTNGLVQAGSSLVGKSMGFLQHMIQSALEPEGVPSGRPGIAPIELMRAVTLAEHHMNSNLDVMTGPMAPDIAAEVKEIVTQLFNAQIRGPGSLLTLAEESWGQEVGPQPVMPRQRVHEFLEQLVVGRGIYAVQGDLTGMQAHIEYAKGDPAMAVNYDQGEEALSVDQYGEMARKSTLADESEMKRQGGAVHRQIPGPNPRQWQLNTREQDRMDSTGERQLLNIEMLKRQASEEPVAEQPVVEGPPPTPGTKTADRMQRRNPGSARYNPEQKQRLVVSGQKMLQDSRKPEMSETDRKIMEEAAIENLRRGGLSDDDIDRILKTL